MMNGDYMSGWSWAAMGVVGALVIVLIVAVILLVGRSRGDEPRQSSRQLLDERLARGEISSDEYGELRSALAHRVSADAQP